MNTVNSRIAKNTALLYVRMVFIVLIGLYTSRIVLSVLGVSDYGIFNVVGGVVSMLAFLNSAMVAASQRFISYELGRGEDSEINVVFSTSFYIHLTIALIVFVLSEAVGIWFVNTHLNIPDTRMVAANWVFQASIIIFILTIITVPYNSSVIAHEHMSVFAIVSIVDAILKLVLIVFLKYIPTDKLILYSILMIGVSFVDFLIYFIYSRKNFAECRKIVKPATKKFKEMFSFAGWNVFGNIGSSFKEQCVSIVINIFCGTAVNAARGVAIQVNNIVNTFSSNVVMAINPQITKQYAAGDIGGSKKLVFASAKYSFFMLMLIAIPVYINKDYLLDLWLVEVPEYSSSFLAVILLVSLIYSLSAPITTALQATGRIKIFQIGVSSIMLLDIPAAYLLLKIGFSPVIAILPSLATNTLCLIFRFSLIRRYIPQYNLHEYYIGVVLRSLVVFVISFILCLALSNLFRESFLKLLLTTLTSIIIMTCMICGLGLTDSERKKGVSLVVNRLRKKNLIR
jgi:O-antigen/teichoic acid export membrane protein